MRQLKKKKQKLQHENGKKSKEIREEKLNEGQDSRWKRLNRKKALTGWCSRLHTGRLKKSSQAWNPLLRRRESRDLDQTGKEAKAKGNGQQG